MAGKGFTLTTATPPTAKPERYVPPPPPHVVDKANADGVEVLVAVQRDMSPEHPTPGGKNHVAEEIPPIKATPPAKMPMRLDGAAKK